MEHKPETQTVKKLVQVHFDHQITLVSNVQNSAIKPVIIVLDMKNKTGLIVEVEIIADCNLNKTFFKKKIT